MIYDDFWRFFEEFWRNSFVEEKKIKNFHQAETLLFWWPQRPPQPPRSNMTSDLESLVETSYATIFVWTVHACFGPFFELRPEEEHNSPLLDLLASPQVKIIRIFRIFRN